ncbi:MAG: hypothetical protein ACD_5C00029G0001 [uncultured bacterium]|nr:MAG: hypothetical protein ACD_5C00029G0001 [uncultured bacterium]
MVAFAHPQFQKQVIEGVGSAFARDVPFCFYVTCRPGKMKDGFMIYEFSPVEIDIDESFYHVVN